jgi:hypothetical protein
MKYLAVALVVAIAGCDKKPADPMPGAGSSAPGATGSAALAEARPTAAPAERPAPIAPGEPPRSEIDPSKARRDRAREELEERRERLRKDLEERLDRARGIGQPSSAASATLCATLHTMQDLVTKLSAPRNAMSHEEECKAIRELKSQSEALHDHRFIDLELEDIVAGRCGPKVMARREDLESFYEQLHRSLAEQLKPCGP